MRLSQIAILENGDRSSKYPVESDYVDFGIPFFGAKNMDGDVMSFENVRYISETKFSELGNGKLQDKDFICLLRGSVGKCAIFLRMSSIIRGLFVLKWLSSDVLMLQLVIT